MLVAVAVTTYRAPAAYWTLGTELSMHRMPSFVFTVTQGTHLTGDKAEAQVKLCA